MRTNFISCLIILILLLPSTSALSSSNDIIDFYFGHGSLDFTYPNDSKCYSGKTNIPKRCYNPESFSKDFNCYELDCPIQIKTEHFLCNPIRSDILFDNSNNLFFLNETEFGLVFEDVFSINNNGFLRWRYSLCNLQLDPDTSYRNTDMIMDSYENIFFIYDNILYSFDVNGNLLVNKKIKFKCNADVKGKIALSTKGDIFGIFDKKNRYSTDPSDCIGYFQINRKGDLIKEVNLSKEMMTENIKILRTIALLNDDNILLSIFKREPSNNREIAYFLKVNNNENKIDNIEIPLNKESVDLSGYLEDNPDFITSISIHSNKIYSFTYGGAVLEIESDLSSLKRVLNLKKKRIFEGVNPVFNKNNHLVTVTTGVSGGAVILFNPENVIDNKIYSECGKEDKNEFCNSEPEYAKYEDHPGIKWVLYGESSSLSTPAITLDGIIYAVPGRFYALNPDGSIKWKYENGNNGLEGLSILNDGLIAFSNMNGYIQIIEDKTPGEDALKKGWSIKYHDRYRSKNAVHPHDYSNPSYSDIK